MDPRIERFKPVFWLTDDEPSEPTSMEEYIPGCGLKNILTKKRVHAKTILTKDTFEKLLRDDPTVQEAHNSLYRLEKFTHSGEEAPVYVKVEEKDDETWITYASLHAYNYVPTVCCGPNILTHEMDLEHVTVRLRENELESVFYSQHSGGEWVHSNKIERDGDRPVVYIAKGTHAMYPTQGVKTRYWVTVDKREQGQKWDPERVIMAEDQVWATLFRGTLGNGHVDNFVRKSWWTTPWTEK